MRNTTITYHSSTDYDVLLYGNTIVQVRGDKISLCTCGYETLLTSRRMNTILKNIGVDLRVTVRKGVWYCGNEAFYQQCNTNYYGVTNTSLYYTFRKDNHGAETIKR